MYYVIVSKSNFKKLLKSFIQIINGTHGIYMGLIPIMSMAGSLQVLTEYACVSIWHQYQALISAGLYHFIRFY